MDSKKITLFIVFLFSTLAALYLGVAAATAQLEAISWLVIGVILSVCVSLGQRIWLLLPFMAGLNLSLRLPGQPDTLLIGQLLMIFFSTLMLLIRKLPFKLIWGELKLWILLLTLFVAQVYIRNPVSVGLLGGDTVGGKAYPLYAITLFCCLILMGIKVSQNELKLVTKLAIIGGVLSAFVSIIGQLIPSIGYITGSTYENGDEKNYENFGKKVDEGMSTRIGYLNQLGNNLSLWVSSFISPLRAIIKPLYFILIFTSIVAAMLSGFRNAVIMVGFIYITGIAYRSGKNGVFLSTVIGSFALILLALVNLISPLHPNIQRSLTFLPGTWEQRYKDDANDSSEWRFEMWKEALTSEKWIKNKWLGDGLGFSAEDLEKSFTLKAASATTGLDFSREQMLINGAYHSGPISVIRTIGYIGLLVFLMTQIRLAVHAHRLIKKYKNTEWFPLCLFIGIPAIIAPIFFTLVFGDFKADVVNLLMSCGMVQLLKNNLPVVVRDI